MTEDGIEPGVEPTGRWREIGAATLLAAALGLVGRQPALVLVAGVGVTLLAYARLVGPPPLDLSIRRTVKRQDAGRQSDADGDAIVEGEAAEPGDRIAVTLEVENAGDRTIQDLRLVDGVPAGLSVADGVPRIGTTLRPGETATCRYELAARAGRHEFEPVAAIAQDVAGVVERRERIAVDDGDAIEAEPGTELQAGPPTRSPAARFPGTDDADATGEGVAFEGVRAYRHGDPPGRIDWRRLARTGELTTVTYREERGHAVVLVVDARPAAAVAPSPEAPTAIERSLAAASAFADRLAAAGHRVGVARLGNERAWIGPGSGPAHEQRVAELLAERRPGIRADDGEETGASDADTAEPSAAREWLRERLPQRAEVLVASPCTDDGIVDLARYLDATGSPVSVVSPDPTDDATAGRELARMERRQRLRSLRAADVPVVDWPADTSLDSTIREATVQAAEVHR